VLALYLAPMGDAGAIIYHEMWEVPEVEIVDTIWGPEPPDQEDDFVRPGQVPDNPPPSITPGSLPPWWRALIRMQVLPCPSPPEAGRAQTR